MTWQTYLPYLLVMALVTYLIRMLPLTLMRRQIRNRRQGGDKRRQRRH